MNESEKQRRYQISHAAARKRYDAANTRSFGLKINRKTDADILARLSAEPNFQGYIKRLIREDIARSGGASPENT